MWAKETKEYTIYLDWQCEKIRLVKHIAKLLTAIRYELCLIHTQPTKMVYNYYMYM